MREFDQFTDEIELSVAGRCDGETLWELYDDFVRDSLGEEHYWDRHRLSEIERFHECTEVHDIEVDEVEFTGGDGVSFTALVHFDVSGSTDDGDNGYSGRDTFTYRASGYMETPRRAVVEDLKFLP